MKVHTFGGKVSKGHFKGMFTMLTQYQARIKELGRERRFLLELVKNGDDRVCELLDRGEHNG